MKRRAAIARLKAEAADQGLAFAVHELTRHTAITVGGTTRTLGRHSELDDLTVRKFWEQYASELGKGWWRQK